MSEATHCLPCFLAYDLGAVLSQACDKVAANQKFWCTCTCPFTLEAELELGEGPANGQTNGESVTYRICGCQIRPLSQRFEKMDAGKYNLRNPAVKRIMQVRSTRLLRDSRHWRYLQPSYVTACQSDRKCEKYRRNLVGRSWQRLLRCEALTVFLYNLRCKLNPQGLANRSTYSGQHF